MTPTQTKTPTPSPTFVYVYESCSNIAPNAYKTQIVQTIKSPITSTIGECFKDASGNCWKYNGQVSSSYIVPPTFIPVTYSGNYFTSAPTTIYANCQSCSVQPAILTACGSGGVQPCIGGTIDDTLTASVTVYDSNGNPFPVSVNTTFEVFVYYDISGGGTCASANNHIFTLTILAGSSSAIADCNSGGIYVGPDISGQSAIGCQSGILTYYGNNVDTITIGSPGAGC
jgi:hypothetical protein